MNKEWKEKCSFKQNSSWHLKVAFRKLNVLILMYICTHKYIVMVKRKNVSRSGKPGTKYIFVLCVLLLNFHLNHTEQYANERNRSNLNLSMSSSVDKSRFINNSIASGLNVTSNQDSTYRTALLSGFLIIWTLIIFWIYLIVWLFIHQCPAI